MEDIIKTSSFQIMAILVVGDIRLFLCFRHFIFWALYGVKYRLPLAGAVTRP